MVRRKTAEASLVGKTSLRVRFSEVDSMQIVWHGEYVRYFEDGREAFGREFAGLGYMASMPADTPRRSSNCSCNTKSRCA